MFYNFDEVYCGQRERVKGGKNYELSDPGQAYPAVKCEENDPHQSNKLFTLNISHRTAHLMGKVCFFA